jgi:hypothetical protein
MDSEADFEMRNKETMQEVVADAEKGGFPGTYCLSIVIIVVMNIYLQLLCITRLGSGQRRKTATALGEWTRNSKHAQAFTRAINHPSARPAKQHVAVSSLRLLCAGKCCFLNAQLFVITSYFQL